MEHLTEGSKVVEHQAVESYLRQHVIGSLKQAGFDRWLPYKQKIEKYVETKMKKINNILSEGLDIGTIIRYRIPVELIYHPKFGWCFDGGKKYGLYPILDQLR